jgi:protein O-mannosyl-transferase
MPTAGGPSGSPKSPRSRLLLPSALAAVLAAALYLNTLDNPFVFDDFRMIVENSSILSLSDIRSIVYRDVTRPIVNLSYAIDTRIWGRSPVGYHLTNLFLHILNVVLVVRLTFLAGEDRTRGTVQLLRPDISSESVACATGVLFAAHPMMTQAVGYVTGRSEVLYSAFFLLAFLAGRRFLLDGGRRWWGACVALWVAAMLTKESAAMLSFVLLGYDWFVLHGSPADKRRRFVRLGLPLLAVTFVAGAGRIALLRLVEYPESAFDWRLMFVAADAFFRYLLLFLSPRDQTIFHVVPFLSPLDPRAIAGAIGLVAFVTLTWSARRFHSLFAFGLLWFLLLMVPSSLLFLLGRGEAVAEHRAYLPAAGLFLTWGSAFSIVWHRVARWRRLIAVTATVFLLGLSLQTLTRNAIWNDPVVLSREAVQLAPDHWIPRLLLAETLRQNGRCDEAVVEYQATIARRSSEEFPYSKLAECLVQVHRLDDAEQALRQLAALNPASQDAAIGLGTLALLGDRREESRAHFEQALARNPAQPRAKALMAFLDGSLTGPDRIRLCNELRSLTGRPVALGDCSGTGGGVEPPNAVK